MRYAAAAPLLFALMLAASCGSKTPTAPDPTPVAAEDMSPARLNLTAGTRPDTRIDVAAEIVNKNGKPVPGQTVTFAVSSGSVSPATATTDATGIARTIATVNGWATLQATSGALAHSFPVIGPPTTTVEPLAVSIFVAPVTVGTSSYFSLAVSGSSGPVTVTNWNFGDGSTASAAAAVTHTYGSAGNYTASVSVRDGSGRTASATATARVHAAPIVAAPSLIATATCTAGKVNLATTCNITVTEGVIRTGEITTVDWVWADGESNSLGVPTASHIYRATGTFAIAVTVTLSDGRIVRTATTVTVTS